jgi:DNA-binding CsgD family transcriptional regulator
MTATLMGFVATARTAIGMRVTWQSGTEEKTIELARSALGATEFDIAFNAGRQLPLADAVARALQLEPVFVRAIAPAPVEAQTDAYGLSPRERQVLRLLSKGMSNDEIGEALFISPRTASTHVANILGKLGVNSRVAAVATAMKNGLV